MKFEEGVCVTKVVGLAGPMGVGKTTLARLIQRHFPGSVEILPFAAPLKRAVSALTGCSLESLDEFEFKRSEFLPGVTYRRMLQTLGTEWGRQTISDSFWTDVMRRSLHISDAPVVIIDDVRFENEAALVREFGGTVIHISRFGVCANGGHPSENALRIVAGDLCLLSDNGNPSVTADVIMRGVLK